MDQKKIPAYELVSREEIADIQSTGYLLKHKKSGARVMVLENEDDNKVFNIAFRTTPVNSTGVAHIMEHSVLCGSRKYPSKDPFVELVKGSMNTFLNAMTYPDKTMFPVASCNDTDLHHLIQVYLDAVFFPNIYQKEEIFRQEGWNYQIDKPEDPLTYNGVVYNEMKGAYSSPEDVLEQEIMSSLFPDTTYFWESGGNPENIPDLSYEEFLEFHRTYYHPSNSYLYLYGNMDFEKELNWIDKEYLCQFEEKKVASEIKLQPSFEAPVRLLRSYSIAQNDTEEDNTYLSYNAAIGTSLDTRLASAFAVLEYVLLEAPDAPLKEALLHAGIGKDIMSSYDSGTRQPVFSVIAKNANQEDEERFCQVITEELQRLAAEGLDPNAIRAAINIMEFKFREADYGGFPKGLIYGIDVFDSWLYEDDSAFLYLRQLDDFAFLKAQVGTGYYEELIQKWLLENKHASTAILVPERGLTTKLEQDLERQLAEKKAQMSEEEIAHLVEKTRQLRSFQETPSSQEELQTIPMLSRTDLKKEAAELKNEVHDWNGTTVLRHDYQTNGIAYMTLLFDASGIAREDLPYFGILKNVIGMVDTEHYGYGEFYNEINQNTGGITPGISIFPNEKDPGRLKAAFGIQVRTLYDKMDFSFQMIEEMLFTSNLDQEKRLEEIIRKLKSRTSAQLNSSGSATAAVRGMSYFSASSLLNDCVGGVEFYRTVEEIEKNFEEKKELLKQKLKCILQKLLRRDGLMLSFTGTAEALERVRPQMEHLQMRLTKAEIPDAAGTPKEPGNLAWFPPMEMSQKNEGFLTPAKIQYVARTGNFKTAGYQYHGALRVLKVILSYEYLWSNVRVIGGAYGCSSGFGHNGDTYFSSYRDPKLKETNEVYEGIPEYLRAFTVEERDMTKYVIGTVGDMDTPLPPMTRGKRSLNAYLGDLTMESIQKERDEVLQATQEDIRALAPLMEAVLSQNCLCVLGNEEKLKEEKEMFRELKEL